MVGYDAGKNIIGRKRFMTVDTLGLVLRVLVTAGSVPEREGGKRVLKRVKQMGNSVSRLHTIWVDGGFDGEPFMIWVMDGKPRRLYRWCCDRSKRKGLCCSSSGGWWNGLKACSWGAADWSADVELLPETSETFIYLAMIRIMVRRLA